MNESDVFERIRRLENLIILDLVLTSAILGEKAIQLVMTFLS